MENKEKWINMIINAVDWYRVGDKEELKYCAKLLEKYYVKERCNNTIQKVKNEG